MSVKTNLSYNNLIFLVDSEAKISVIKQEQIPKNYEIDSNDNISIRGVTDGRIQTLGTAIIDIQINNVIFEHKFYIVDNTFDIPTDGILGKDFLKPHNFCIN